jgi:hypothetical protein
VCQGNQGGAIGRGIGQIGRIDQFFAGRDDQQAGAKFSGLSAAIFGQPDHCLVIACADKLLQLIQPGTGIQSQRFESVLVDTELGLTLEGIDLHRRALIQGDRTDAEQRLVHNQFFGNPNFGEISADTKAD